MPKYDVLMQRVVHAALDATTREQALSAAQASMPDFTVLEISCDDKTWSLVGRCIECRRWLFEGDELISGLDDPELALTAAKCLTC